MRGCTPLFFATDNGRRTTDMVDKDAVANVLSEIGTLLELQGENPFRAQAYHNAARVIQQLDRDLGEVVREGKLQELPSIGPTLVEKITTLLDTGRLAFHEDLKKKTPPGLVRMLHLPGMG